MQSIERLPEKQFLQGEELTNTSVYRKAGRELLGITAACGAYGKYIQWYTCRETFHSKINSLKRTHCMCKDSKGKNRIFFETTNSDNVMAFVDHAERLLKLKQKAKFRETNSPNVLSCYPGVWWLKSKVRFDLFTILLRAGTKYNPKTKGFWACANKNSYLRYTMKAFKRFMNGNIIYKHRSGHYDDERHFTGWVDTFRKMKDENVKERLVKVANRKRKKICND